MKIRAQALFLPRFPGLIVLTLLQALAVPALAQEKTSPAPDLRAAVTRHLDMTYSMPSYRTKEEWLARRDALRTQILVSAGLWPMPEKCPLNANIFGRLDRGSYSVEKVYFESYPGFLVTGNLYRPLGRKGPFPAVLSPHGHWAYGRLQNAEACSVPTRCIALARGGFVVFSYDMVGYNDSRQVDHRLQGDREALWGIGSLGLHLWNSIRAVDFLESLPDVDKSRLGCTGASGGGTQTFLLTAVDDRIQVSAPVNMISAHMQGGDVCENTPNLRIDTNNMEIGALMAPRPMLMVSATGDWTKNTLEVEYPAIQKIYKLLGVEDRVSAVRVQADHNYNRESREHMYRWFGRWMLGADGEGTVNEKGVRIEFPNDMLVFYERHQPEGLKTQSELVDYLVRSAETAVTSRKPADPAGWEKYRTAFGPALRFSLMAEFPGHGEVQTSAVLPVQKASYRQVRFYLSRKAKGDCVPATLYLPAGKTEIRQGVLLIHPGGASAFETADEPGKLVEALLKLGMSVLMPDVFNTGRAQFQRTEKRNFFTTYNRTDEANRIQDVLTALSYMRGQAGTLPVKVVGFGPAGLWCLLARALADDEAGFAVDFAGFAADSDDAYLKGLNIPGIRRAGDFRTALVLNARSPLWVGSAGNGFPKQWVQEAYASLGKEKLLRVENSALTDAGVLEWLQPPPAMKRK